MPSRLSDREAPVQPQLSVPEIDFESLRPLLWIAAILAFVAAVGALLADQPLIAIAAVAAVPTGTLMIRFRDAAIVVTMFLMYANVPAVAVRFHGVPSIFAIVVLSPMLLPLAYDVLVRREPFIVTRTLPWVLGFVLVQFVSACFSTVPVVAMDTVKTSIMEGLVIYFAITNVIRNETTLRRATFALLAAGALMGALSGWQQATDTFENDYGGFAQVSQGEGFYVNSGRGEVRQRRLAGPIGEKNRYAQTMLMLIPLGVFNVWGNRDLAAKTFAGVASALIFLAFVLTFSRGSTLGLLLMVAVASSMGYLKPKQLLILGLLGSVILIAMPRYRTRLATIPSAMGILKTRGTLEEEPDGAIRGRVTEMLAAANIWLDHPILGVGPDLSQQFTRQYGMIGGYRALEGNRKAHCLYLELLAEVGLVGTIVFAGMIWTSLRQLIRIRHGHRGSQISNISASYLLAMVAYLTTGVFLHFSYVRFFWLILAMADTTQYVSAQACSHVEESQ